MLTRLHLLNGVCGGGRNLAGPGMEILSSHVAQQKQDGYFNGLKYSRATTAFIIKHIYAKKYI